MAYANDFIVKNGLVVSTTATVRSETNSVSTDSGALTVSGGAGIALDLRVGGTIYSPNIVGLITTATNLAGGGTGSIPFQTSLGQTQFIGIGQNAYALVSNGTTATWQAVVNSLAAGTDTAISSTTGSITIWNTSTLQSITQRGATTDQAISITNTTASSSVATGALVVTGGLGVGGYVYAGRLYDDDNRVVTRVSPNGSTYIGVESIVSAGTATSFTIKNLGVTDLTGSTYLGISTSTGSVILTNLGVQTLTAGTDTAVSSNTGTVTVWNTSTLQSITQRGATTDQAISITNTTSATNTTTGALTVSGGVGIRGDLWVGGNITAEQLTIQFTTITSVSTVIDDITTIKNGTNSFNTQSGALQVFGGAGIGGNLFVGGTINGTIVGSITGIASTATNLAGGTAGQIPYQTAPGATSFINTGPAGNILVSQGTNAPSYQNTLTLTGTTAAISTNSGALQVAGGVGVGGSLYAGNLYDSGNRVVTSVTPNGSTHIGIESVTTTGPSTSFTIKNLGVTNLSGTTHLGISTSTGSVTLTNLGVTNLSGSTYLGVSASTGSVNLTNLGVQTLTAGTDTAVSSSTGTVTIWNTSTLQSITSRGATTNQAISITNTASTTSTNSGALTITGGVGIGGGLFVSGTVTATNFIGNIIGTATNSTTATNIAGGTAGQVPYQTAPNSTSFFGPGTAGDVLVSNGTGAPGYQNTLTLTGTTVTTSTNTGALQVVGGVGIGGGIFAGGTVTATLFVGNLTGVATTATNLARGTTGSIPYQVSAGRTDFIGIGASNTVLFSNGTTATWVSTASILGAVTVPIATPTVPGTVFGYTTGNGNTAIGCCSGNITQTGANNFAAGCLALCANTTGSANIAIGGTSLFGNQIGANNVALGCNALRCNNADNNFAAGNGALQQNTTGVNNVAIGCLSLNANKTGSNNFAVGGCALAFNTIGDNNFAVGLCALRVNGTGSNNIAVGYQAMIKNQIGCNNVALGYHAAYGAIASDGGNNNIAVGCQALCKIDTGYDNIALGYQALTANTTGYGNIALGYHASKNISDGCYNVTVGYCASSGRGCQNVNIGYASGSTSTVWFPIDNIAIGTCTLRNDQLGSNIAIGCLALSENRTGFLNIAIGSGAMQCGQGAGSNNVAVGTYGLSSNRGFRNTAIGDSVLPLAVFGRCQTGIGAYGLYSHITGCTNTAVGHGAMYSLQQGSCNIALGHRAGCSLTTATHNLYLGAYSGVWHNCSNCNVILSDGAGNVRLWFTATGAMSFSTATDFGSSGFVLQSNGAGAPPNWQSVGALSAGQATTATNLAGGTTGSIPYQVGSGVTDFIGIGANNTVLFSNGSTATWVSTASILGAVVTAPATPTTLGTVFGYTTGNGNISIGCCSGNITQTGVDNFAAGCCTLRNNTLGYGNTAIGNSALFSNIEGSSNTAIGLGALRSNTLGRENTAIGQCALYNNITGENNTAIGYGALRSNSIGNNNTAIGYYGLRQNSTGCNNTAIGNSALAQNNRGVNNTAIGYYGLRLNTTGSNNTSIGYGAMCSNTIGSNNFAVGCVALGSNTRGDGNIAIGHNSLAFNTTGNCNIAVGIGALCSNTTGACNIAIGAFAGCAITTGSFNVIIGSNNGSTIATSSCNIIISDGAGNARICASNTGSVLIPSNLAAVSTANAALRVVGGIGVGGGIQAGDSLTVTNPGSTFLRFVNTGSTSNISAGSVIFKKTFTYSSILEGTELGSVVASTDTDSSTGGLRIYKSGTATDIGLHANAFGTTATATLLARNTQILITPEANALSTNTGALVVRGGVGIGRDLWVGGDVNIRGATTFQGAVTFTGTSTNIFSTNTVYTDNLINMHVPPGGVAVEWTVDDGRDIGLVFHYYKSQDKNAFLGLNNADGYLEWFADGTEVGAVYTGTEFGIFKTGGIILAGGTTSSSVSTGDLVTAGGAGIGGNLWVGGTINASVTGVSTTATNLAGGATGSIPYQSSAGVTNFIGIGTANTVLTSNGTTATWVATQPGATVADDTTTNATYYPVFSTSTSGAFSQATVSSTKLTWNPSTGQLNVVDINTTSDIATKDNINQIENPLDLLKQISGFAFNWRDTGAKSYGVIAQYIEKILPELVSENQHGLKSVKYLPLIAILIESVKTLSTEIEEMKRAGK